MTWRARATRLNLVAALCLLPFVLVVPRLVWLQLVSSESLDRRAELQTMRRMSFPPERGEILDRSGVRLAYSVADTLPPDEKRDDPHAVTRMKRLYPFGEAASQLVGFLDARGRGRGGIEKALESELCGHPGWATTLVLADGRSFMVPGRPGKPVTRGHTVTLTLDADLQDVAHSRLRRAVEEEHALGGCLVAVDPTTGEVLALAGYPSFDPEAVRQAPGSAMQIRAVTAPYEPGSTFKLVTATAALGAKLMTPNTIIHCENGRYAFGARVVTDHEPMGALPLHSCFAHSSNIAFAKVGRQCGQILVDTARRLGFGSPTGLGLPGESAGYLPRAEPISMTTAVSMSIGYEVMVTPLQLAMGYAAIANDGVLMRPWIVRSIQDPAGKIVYRNRPEPVRRVVDASVARDIRGFMREVVTDGTGRAAGLEWIDMAGKTGTAEKVIDGAYSGRRHWATFVGVAPADAPRIVVLVLIDEPKSHFGGQAAAPVVREVLEAYRRLPGALIRPEYATLNVPAEKEGRSWADFWVGKLKAAPRDDGGRAAGDMGGLPDARGLSKREALKLLTGRGFATVVEGEGVVIEQTPAPGDTVEGPITLVCEPGPRPPDDGEEEAGNPDGGKPSDGRDAARTAGRR